MKTTIDIPEKLMEEAMVYAGTRTKRETVIVALQKYNRKAALKKLVSNMGDSTTFMTPESLHKLRQKEIPLPCSDILIAACAFTHQAQLEYQDRHFATLETLYEGRD